MSDVLECPGSEFGHMLAITYRRPWRDFFIKEHVIRCWDCDLELVMDTEIDARWFVFNYRKDGFDPEPYLEH